MEAIMKQKLFLFALLTLLIATSSYAVEPIQIIESLDRSMMGALSAGARPDSQGAMGRNREHYIAPSFQRAALTLVVNGITQSDAALIEEGMKGVHYGFKQQRIDDGSFHMGVLESGSLQQVDRLSSASFFLSATGIIYRLVLESEFRSRFEPDLLALKPKIKAAMLWLKNNQELLRSYDKATANRLVFDALAFKVNGQNLGDSELEKIGESFLTAALALQAKDGVFLEKGGHDSSYQATTLLLLQNYWLFAPQEKLFRAIEKGMVWERARIASTGEVSADGNTRTGVGKESFLGKEKGVNYPEVMQALLYWSVISHTPSDQVLAKRVFNFAVGVSGNSDVAKKQSLRLKKAELVELGKNNGVPRAKLVVALALYRQAENAYLEGQLDEADSLLDQAILTLKR
jgi:hypothetical protein